MKLTLQKLYQALAKEQLQAAEKNKVRECDETDKGVFVAYVDEGSNSFDTSLTVPPKGELTKAVATAETNLIFAGIK